MCQPWDATISHHLHTRPDGCLPSRPPATQVPGCGSQNTTAKTAEQCKTETDDKIALDLQQLNLSYLDMVQALLAGSEGCEWMRMACKYIECSWLRYPLTLASTHSVLKAIPILPAWNVLMTSKTKVLNGMESQSISISEETTPADFQ